MNSADQSSITNSIKKTFEIWQNVRKRRFNTKIYVTGAGTDFQKLEIREKSSEI